MNHGERNELIKKIKLIEMRDTNIPLSNGTVINSVGFNREYTPLPSDFVWDGINEDDDRLLEICENLLVTKSPANSKSDVYINSHGYSLKSFSSANPAIVNHTTRPGFETACTNSGMDINELDNLIDNYWTLRESGIITEDIPNSHLNSPFKDAKDLLKPILEYFLFDGTGRGPSTEPAHFILSHTNPLDSETWSVINHDDAVDLFWDRLVLSIRPKGMPRNYTADYNGVNAPSINRWTRLSGGKYRGALHVRVKL